MVDTVTATPVSDLAFYGPAELLAPDFSVEQALAERAFDRRNAAEIGLIKQAAQTKPRLLSQMTPLTLEQAAFLFAYYRKEYRMIDWPDYGFDLMPPEVTAFVNLVLMPLGVFDTLTIRTPESLTTTASDFSMGDPILIGSVRQGPRMLHYLIYAWSWDGQVPTYRQVKDRLVLRHLHSSIGPVGLNTHVLLTIQRFMATFLPEAVALAPFEDIDLGLRWSPVRHCTPRAWRVFRAKAGLWPSYYKGSDRKPLAARMVPHIDVCPGCGAQLISRRR
jgi:hypothetical protein